MKTLKEIRKDLEQFYEEGCYETSHVSNEYSYDQKLGFVYFVESIKMMDETFYGSYRYNRLLDNVSKKIFKLN